MPRTCTICAHSERATIDEALLGCETFRTIAHRFNCSEDALKRHKSEHLPVSLAHAHAAAEAANGDDLLAQLRSLQARTLALLDKAESAGRLGTAVMAVREARGNVELLAKLRGELDARPVVNLILAPEWLALRAAILAALLAYPEARVAVADRLLALEAGHARE